MISKLKIAGSGILLSILGMAGCGDDDGLVENLARKTKETKKSIREKPIDALSLENKPGLKEIAQAYINIRDQEELSSTLKRAAIDTYNIGHLEKKIPIETLVKMIYTAETIIPQRENFHNIKTFTNRFIKLSSEYNPDSILSLMSTLDSASNSSYDTTADFIEAASYILDRCEANKVELKDFSRLILLVNNLDNQQDDSVQSFLGLMQLTEKAIKQYNTDIKTLLEIATTLDQSCNYFSEDTISEINEGLFYFAKLHSVSGMTKNSFISELGDIAKPLKCRKINTVVQAMRNIIENRQNRCIRISGPDNVEAEKLELEIRKNFNADNYKHIALDQYFTNRDKFKGKEVKIAAVPMVQSTDFSDTYILKLHDDKKTLDCFYSGNTNGVKLGLVYNDVQLVINENINASTKRRIFVYGTLEDNLLHIDAVKALKDIRRLR